MSIRLTATLLVGVAAVTVFARLLREDGGGWMASASPIVFGIGCAAFLGTLVIGLAVTPGAAAKLVRTGVVPSGFVSWQRVATGLYAGHMLMSYATFALLGAAMLRGSLAPAWLGWFGVVTGCLGVVALRSCGEVRSPRRSWRTHLDCWSGSCS